MAILVLQHDAADKPGRVGQILRDNGFKLRILQLHEGDPVPADLDDVDGVVSLGGPMNVDEGDKYPWIPQEMALLKQAHEAELPVVGLCLGHQLIAAALGGEVGKMATPELGFAEVNLAFPGTMEIMLSGIPWKTQQFHAHGYEVTKLPPGATPLAGSKLCRTQAFKLGMRTYGFQYHFEWTKQDIIEFLDETEKSAAKGGFGAGMDIPAARASVDQHYALYRHLGDRLCTNLATYLFAIDKRYARPTIEPRPNFHAALS